MSGPSKHFSWREFECHDGTPYPARWRHSRALRLASVLEGFRTYLGGYPLELGSVYRTPRWNRQQGGAAAGQHPQGRAADPHPPRARRGRVPFKLVAMPIALFHEKAREYAKLDRRVGGLGFYRWGVHLDIRARRNGRLAVWNKVRAGTRMHDRKK